MKRPLFSRDLSESKARTNVAPLGAEGSEARAWGQIMCGYSRDRSARLPIGRRAHVAADSYRFGIFWDAPSGGSTGSAGGNEVAAPTVGRKCHLVASSAGVGQGDTLRRWKPRVAYSVFFWDAPLGGSTGSAGGNEVAAPTVGRKCHLVASSAGVGQGDTLR